MKREYSVLHILRRALIEAGEAIPETEEEVELFVKSGALEREPVPDALLDVSAVLTVIGAARNRTYLERESPKSAVQSAALSFARELACTAEHDAVDALNARLGRKGE